MRTVVTKLCVHKKHKGTKNKPCDTEKFGEIKENLYKSTKKYKINIDLL